MHLLQHVVGDVLDEPVERFTFQTFLQFQLRCDVSHAGVPGGRLPGLKDLYCSFWQYCAKKHFTAPRVTLNCRDKSNIFAPDCKCLKDYETPCVKDLFVLFVHPHFYHSLVVDCDDGALGLLGQVTFKEIMILFCSQF